VGYLNASKVLTTGSALTFDGTNLGVNNKVIASFFSVEGANNGLGRYSSGVVGIQNPDSGWALRISGGWTPFIYLGNKGAIYTHWMGGWAAEVRFQSPSSVDGTLADTLNLTSLGTVAVRAGSVTYPSLCKIGDVSTGVWFPAEYTFAVSTNSTERLRISSTGVLTVGSNSAAPAISLDPTTANSLVVNSSGSVIIAARATPPSLSTNGTMVFALTSNTNLRISVRGTDGTTRVANITLA
jgi:hypothetical protein